jgi:phosphatidylglycerophosphate synthase
MNPWRERLARWFSPMARRCPLSPNAISLIALGLNLAAAYLLLRQWFLPAIAFLTVGGLADAFDGIVARVQNRSSRFGDFLDHFADRVSDTLVVTGWLFGSGVRLDFAIAAIILVMLNGYSGTQIEATWHERSYESVGRGEFVLALIIFPIVSHLLFAHGWSSLVPGGLRIPDWLTLLLIVAAILGIVQRFALASRLERRNDPQTSDHR